MYDLLRGLSVIEASSFVASPSAGLYCAQMGAEVIRVDQIGGGPDANRWPLTDEGQSLYWENLNRAKKSVALDLRGGEGRELLAELVRATGQCITNFPVGSFMAHDTLAQGRADLITVRVMGWPDGSPALDYTVNNAVGFPSLTGPGPEPVNHVLAAWDLLTGSYAAFALLAALRHRDETGQGQEVRLPLSDVAIGTLGNLGMIAEARYTGEDRERLGNAVFGAFGRDFTTKDGHRTMLMAITPKQWRALVGVLKVADQVAAIEAARGVSFDKDEGIRFTHRDALFPVFEQAVAHWDLAPLEAALDEAGGTHGRYRTMSEAANDASMVDDNPIFGANAADAPNPSGFAYPGQGPFATIPQLDRQPPAPAPRNGAHSEEVLAERLGLTQKQIGALVDAGTVGVSS